MAVVSLVFGSVVGFIAALFGWAFFGLGFSGFAFTYLGGCAATVTLLILMRLINTAGTGSLEPARS